MSSDQTPSIVASEHDGVLLRDRQVRLLKQAMRMANMSAWEYSRETGRIEQTGELYSIFEADPSEMDLDIGHFQDNSLDAGRHPILDPFLTPESRERLAQRRFLALETGEGWDLVLEAHTARGRRIWVRNIAVIELVDGQVVRASGVLQDITHQREMQEQLTRALKMESVGQLTSGIAHDFNNLLTIIRGHLELALMDIPEDSQLALDLAEVERAARSATALTQQLLIFSRKDASAPSEVALSAVLEQFEATLKTLLGSRIALRMDLAPDLWQVRADVSQLEQLAMNLAVNARDAMPHGGAFDITARNVTLGAFDRELGLLAPGDYIELLFRDTGGGMSPDVRMHAFDSYFTTKGEGKGTGLGLSICQNVVSIAHGHIDIASSTPGGTTLRVRLPRAHRVMPEPLSAPHARGVETLLVCDDEPALRALISAGLRAYGYRVLEAADPAGALSTARQDEHIDLLVTDVLLPQMSGKGLAAEFLAVRPHTPVLFMSAMPKETISRSGERFPATPFLEKPFSPSTLARRVRDLLDSRPRVRS